LRAVVARLRTAGQWQVGDPPMPVVLDAGYDVCRLAYRACQQLCVSA
jgi:hypothetical protein